MSGQAQKSHYGQEAEKTAGEQRDIQAQIAPAYVFLASAHCSSYISGEILPIIGGYNGG